MIHIIYNIQGIPRWLSGKESMCQCRNHEFQEDFLEEEMATHSSMLAKSPGQSSLAGYSTRGCKQSDMTEHAHTHI